jgi:hypothetical protein
MRAGEIGTVDDAPADFPFQIPKSEFND